MIAKLLSRYWWVLLVRGVFAIIFGVLAYTWPGITLAVLIYFFAIYAFVDGVFNVVHAISGAKENKNWVLLLIGGICGIGLGILTWFLPGVTAVVLLIFIAVLAIVLGVKMIILAIRLRKEIKGEWILILAGILSAAAGVFMIARPVAGALAVLYLIAGWAIVMGGLLIGLSFRVRKLQAAA
jgi:uncharacterized membrane protein HdeD (DUF308 family)